MSDTPVDGAVVLTEVCSALTNGQVDVAAAILDAKYPYTPLATVSRQFSPHQCMRIFWRDGFVDRYSGNRLVFPGTLRLLSVMLPEHFPYHKNWKMDSCHIGFWELFPTIDHIVPVSRGGADLDENWVTTSMLRNSAKSGFLLEELGWALCPPGHPEHWDGLTAWFLDEVTKNRPLLQDPYLRRWSRAAWAMTVQLSTSGARQTE
jgi:hypothetical protein